MAGKSGKENKKKNDLVLAPILSELAALRHEIEALKGTSLMKEVEQDAPPRDPERVAQAASAFTPIARARLVEALLHGGPQLPAQLGEAAGLSTGSLYHHLREIVASGIAVVRDKSYVLTPEGERLARALFTP